MPRLQNTLALRYNDLFDGDDFVPAKSAARSQPNRAKPGLRDSILSLHVHVRWFAAIAAGRASEGEVQKDMFE
jgi:hypothetical protein